MMGAVSTLQYRPAPLRRVRLYTVTTLALGVVLVTGWTARQLITAEVRLGDLLLLGLVVIVGATGAFCVWWRTQNKPLPDGWIWAWVALALGAVAFLSYGLQTPRLYQTVSPDVVLALIALVVLVLSAVRPVLWALVFTVIAGGVAVAFVEVSPLALVAVVGVSWAAGASSTWIYRLVEELESTREDLAALQVAEERLRFSRDVHDVVGRALSAISVKSQLAAALAQKQDPRALSEMQAVSTIAHQAMGETRDIAAGYRQVDLQRELQGARALLHDAGIHTVVPQGTDTVRHSLREPMALAVREAVTNILRHSYAQTVTITLEPDQMTIINDGVAPHPEAGSGGSGLEGLRSRIEDYGGHLSITHQGEEFCLQVTFRKGTA